MEERPQVIRSITNDTGIDQHLYVGDEWNKELVKVPPDHIFEELSDGTVTIRPVGISRRFYEICKENGVDPCEMKNR